MEYGYEIWHLECKNLYRAVLLMTISKELSTYKLHLMEVQEVRWEGSATLPAELTFFYGKGNEDHQLHTGLSVHKKIIPAVMRIEVIVTEYCT
jgi:hypothetical protein